MCEADTNASGVDTSTVNRCAEKAHEASIANWLQVTGEYALRFQQIHASLQPRSSVSYAERALAEIIVEAVESEPRRQGVRAYSPIAINPANAHYIHLQYRGMMNLLLSTRCTPSFRTLAWPAFVVRDFHDISYPAVVHFLGQKLLGDAPESKHTWERDSDYVRRYKLRIAELAFAELMDWAPSVFGVQVIDRILNVTERKLERKWQIEVVRVLTQVVTDFVKEGDLAKILVMDQEYEAFTEMHSEYVRKKRAINEVDGEVV